MLLRCLIVCNSNELTFPLRSFHINVKANVEFTLNSSPGLYDAVPNISNARYFMRILERPFQDYTDLDFEPYYNALWRDHHNSQFRRFLLLNSPRPCSGSNCRDLGGFSTFQ
jgi:hypothetical protein